MTRIGGIRTKKLPKEDRMGLCLGEYEKFCPILSQDDAFVMNEWRMRGKRLTQISLENGH